MRRDRSRKPRRKVCSFCVDHAEQIDYKDVAKLRRFTTERGKILPRRGDTWGARIGICTIFLSGY